MKKYKIIIFFLLLSCSAFTQDSNMVYYGDDFAFKKVEIESEFPGGLKAWARFLQQNLVYPAKAIRKRIQGEVVVQFVIDDKGRLFHIEAISGPELLRAAAEDVIRKSPEWIPAFNKGIKVKSYKKQPIAFRLN